LENNRFLRLLESLKKADWTQPYVICGFVHVIFDGANMRTLANTEKHTDSIVDDKQHTDRLGSEIIWLSSIYVILGEK